MDVTLTSEVPIQDFFIESLVNGEARGYFVDSNFPSLQKQQPQQNPNVWRELLPSFSPSLNDRDVEWLSGASNQRKAEAVGGRPQQWPMDHEDLKMIHHNDDDIDEDIWDRKDWKSIKSDNRAQSPHHKSCGRNIWTGSWIYGNKISMNWSFDQTDILKKQGNETLAFR